MNSRHGTSFEDHKQQYFDFMRLERSVSESLRDIQYNKQLFMSKLSNDEVRQLMIAWQEFEEFQSKRQLVKGVS